VKVAGAQSALGEAEMNSPRKEIHSAARERKLDIQIRGQILESRNKCGVQVKKFPQAAKLSRLVDKEGT
jgi:hypothetical protein